MSASQDRVAIRCPGCGAGLDVLGGGRVTLHVCPYCGAALDATENYRLLKRYTDMPKAETPFSIGQEGEYLGLRWRVIGILGLEERSDGKRWHWVDHLIWSPTHGYAWLTLEDGHLLVTRRWRKGSLPDWIGSAAVERAETRPRAYADGEVFDYYETSTSRIVSIEGEFTWTPQPHDLSTAVTLLGPARMLSFVEGANEREVEITSYPPQAALWAGFGIANPPAPERYHPLQSQKPGGTETFLMWASGAFAGISLFLSLVLAGITGHEVTRIEARLPVSVPFEIHQTGKLATISLWGPVQDNSWAWFELSVTDPDEAPLFEAGREIGLYSGVDDEGHWQEDRRGTRLSFRPTVAGSYELDLDPATVGFDESETGKPFEAPVQVTIREGASSGVPTLILALIFGLVGAGILGRRIWREKRRWAGSDWEDEDEGDDE